MHLHHQGLARTKVIRGDPVVWVGLCSIQGVGEGEGEGEEVLSQNTFTCRRVHVLSNKHDFDP